VLDSADCLIQVQSDFFARSCLELLVQEVSSDYELCCRTGPYIISDTRLKLDPDPHSGIGALASISQNSNTEYAVYIPPIVRKSYLEPSLFRVSLNDDGFSFSCALVVPYHNLPRCHYDAQTCY